MRFGNDAVAGYCFECSRLCLDARTSELGVTLGPPPKQVKEAPRAITKFDIVEWDAIRVVWPWKETLFKQNNFGALLIDRKVFYHSYTRERKIDC